MWGIIITKGEKFLSSFPLHRLYHSWLIPSSCFLYLSITVFFNDNLCIRQNNSFEKRIWITSEKHFYFHEISEEILRKTILTTSYFVSRLRSLTSPLHLSILRIELHQLTSLSPSSNPPIPGILHVATALSSIRRSFPLPRKRDDKGWRDQESPQNI